jgi:hypothetical protein
MSDDKQFREYERRPRCRCMLMPDTSPPAPLSTQTRAGALAAQLERLHSALRQDKT